ncbi:MAG: hypothetical protein JKX83_11050 [Pseudomonadales bacterium]|nr:hypothetical protein [Pseudomonadales bacterium]
MHNAARNIGLILVLFFMFTAGCTHISVRHIEKGRCLNFPVIDAESKITQMRTKAAEVHYQKAQKLFANHKYLEAVAQHEKSKQEGDYKDSSIKIAESYYKNAELLESNNQYRTAAGYYLQSSQTGRGHKEPILKAASIYYSLGRYFLENNYCRESLYDFERAARLMPDYRDLTRRLS